eukprot:TRINITY_DN40500_c0_g1_i1.p1 TRINITY_DN40500_c0_g1~~TRINITY_DN40500_c0_g1_i1.p1  ORF type:complete len:1791 (-),score=214.23 TRINITY_DN40500_c0_g1_i1:186-5312(-)
MDEAVHKPSDVLVGKKDASLIQPHIDAPRREWMRYDCVVQVLVPGPERRLLLIAPPLRFFNYTNLHLQFEFWSGQDRINFNADVMRATTIPVVVLGTEQPIDPRSLGLSDPPTLATSGQQVSSTSVWHLPPQRFCGVPLPHRVRSKFESFEFTVSAENSGWSERLRPSDKTTTDCILCGRGSSVVYLRTLQQHIFIDKPFPTSVLNVVVLPAFSVMNVTPARLALDVRQDAKAIRSFCGGARDVQQFEAIPEKLLQVPVAGDSEVDVCDIGKHRCSVLPQPAVADPRICVGGSSQVSQSGNIEDSGLAVVEPGAVCHFYQVNSRLPLALRLGLADDTPSIQHPSYWSKPIHDVCVCCANKAAQVELPLGPPRNSPAVEVTCVRCVAAVSCPFLLSNCTSLSLFAGRNLNTFPHARGVIMLDADPCDITLYLDNTSSCASWVQDDESPLLGHPEKRNAPPLREAADLRVVVCQSRSGQSIPANFPSCKLPLPVTEARIGEILCPGEGGSFSFTVIREPVPPLMGGIAAPTIRLKLLPSVMISNGTSRFLRVLGQGPRKTGMKVGPHQFEPRWCRMGATEKIRIQLLQDSEGRYWEQLSEGIDCDSSTDGVRGKFALAMRRRCAEPSSIANVSDVSPKTTSQLRRCAPIAQACFDQVDVLSVEISDALAGVVSINISEQPAVLVGCWAFALDGVVVETDTPTLRSTRPPNEFAHKIQNIVKTLADNVSTASDTVLGRLNGRTRAETPETDASTTGPLRFDGVEYRWGWPLQIGWWQPFASRNMAQLSFVLVLRWADTLYDQTSMPSVQSVRLALTLGRMTPLVALRVQQASASDPFAAACRRQQAVMVSYRPRFEAGAAELSREPLRGLEHCCISELLPKQRERHALLCSQAEARFQAWAESSICSPELVEVTEVTLEQISETAVQWACGYCGTTSNRPLPSSRCDHCYAMLLVDDSLPRSTDEDARYRSTEIKFRLTKIGISTISESWRREVFFGELTDLDFALRRRRSNEDGYISIRDLRVDCQVRSIEHDEMLARKRCCENFCEQLKMDTRVGRELLECPSVLSSVGTSSKIASLATDAGCPCLMIEWNRLLIDDVVASGGDGGQSSMCVKFLRIESRQRWELVLDQHAADGIFQLHAEMIGAIFRYSECLHAKQPRRSFGNIFCSEQQNFVTEFVPPAPLQAFIAEEIRISGFEIGVWGSVELSRIPTSMIPPVFAFLVQIVALSDSLCIEGCTFQCEEWCLSEGIPHSLEQMKTLVLRQYQPSLVLFLASAFGRSNLLAVPKLVVNVMPAVGQQVMEGLAVALEHVDEEYTRARQEDESLAVNSFAEGAEKAAACLRDGVVGISDVVVKPMRELEESGIKGLPTGISRGIMAALIKPLDGILRAARALLRGTAASLVCRCRRRKTPVKEVVANSSKFPGAAKPANRDYHGFSLFGRSPAMRGVGLLRLPRLLFSEGTGVVAFSEWHSHILRCLGPAMTQRLWAVWHLCGDISDFLCIVLCASHDELRLCDLSRAGMHGLRKSHIKRIGHGLHWVVTQHERQRLRRKRDTDQKDTMTVIGMQESDLVTMRIGERTCLLTTQAASPSRKSVIRRSCPCRRRNSEKASAALEAARETHANQVLASWPWKTLLGIDIIDSYDWCQTEGFQSLSKSKPDMKRLMLSTTSWVLRVTTVGGAFTEWPLACQTPSEDVLRRICDEVNQAIKSW